MRTSTALRLILALTIAKGPREIVVVTSDMQLLGKRELKNINAAALLD
jgi:2-phospho-L-lactate guanylyltransferase (CobY/MobA/RfbA family)